MSNDQTGASDYDFNETLVITGNTETIDNFEEDFKQLLIKYDYDLVEGF